MAPTLDAPLTLIRNKAAAKPDAPLALANYGVLPTDALSEVLLRLPSKELCRLRAVCRAWRSLTSDPLFVKAHSSRHPLVVGLLAHGRGIQLLDLSGNIVIKRRSAALLHGGGYSLSMQLDLLCMSTPNGEAYVLNIITGTVSMLPSALEHNNMGRAIFSRCTIGWVSSAAREYKVLRTHMYMTSDNVVQTCEIITLGRDETWRARPRPPVHVAMGPRQSVVIGGVAYFSLSHLSAIMPDCIALFDLVTEEWRPTILQGPLSSLLGSTDEKLVDTGHEINFQLAELNNCLVVVHWNNQDCSTDLWSLMDIQNGLWNKLCTVAYAPHGDIGFSYPLVVLHDGRIVFYVNSAIGAYDPRTSTWADVIRAKGYFAVGIHRRSLLC